MGRLEFITTGNEIMAGLTADTNFSWAAERFSSNGIITSYHGSVGDYAEDLKEAFKRASERSRFIVVTGGLGPTEDDLTADVSADFFGVGLNFDEESFRDIKEKLSRRGRVVLDVHKKQAIFPIGAEIIKNKVGISNGFKFKFKECVFYFLPGVPGEFKAMIDSFVLPDVLKQIKTDLYVLQKVIKTIGLGESEVALKMNDINVGDAELSYRIKYPEVHLKLVVKNNSMEEAAGILERISNSIKHRLGKFVFTDQDINLEQVVAGLLCENNLTVATAESCTGGLLGNLLTDIPGSSEYYLGGVITYNNESKSDLLGVEAGLFDTVGAVSSEVVEQMASGVRKKNNANIGIGISGIAGPGGGTEEKPIGTVYIGVDYMDKVYSFKYLFHGSRKDIKKASAKYALDIVRNLLTNN